MEEEEDDDDDDDDNDDDDNNIIIIIIIIIYPLCTPRPLSYVISLYSGSPIEVIPYGCALSCMLAQCAAVSAVHKVTSSLRNRLSHFCTEFY